MSNKSYYFSFCAVVLLAFILRAATPYPIDALGDDATYAFRSVGYFDHMASQLQTTPYQWFDPVPWWVRLSFHDHPPLFFFIFHLVFASFGMHNAVLTIMPLIMGTVSVALVMLIAARMGGRRAGVIAGFVTAIASGLIWLSRIALLETLLAPLLLLSWYALLRIPEHARWLLFTLLFFGLACITKYTALFFLPTLVLGLILMYRRHASHATRGALMSGAIFFIILLPVVIYNIQMTRTRGHPDYQFTRLFHITTNDWHEDFSRGRTYSLGGFTHTLADTASLAGILLFLCGIAIILASWRRTRDAPDILLLITLASFFFGFAWMGNAPRFVMPLIPFLCIAAGVAFTRVTPLTPSSPFPMIGRAFLLLCIAAMALYSVNTHLLTAPYGRAGISYGRTRAMNYGYAQLDAYLLELYRTHASPSDLWEEGNAQKTLYIYDSNMNYFPRLWYVQRRVTYQGIPFTSTKEFKSLIAQHGDDYFPSQGYVRYAFIHALDGTLLVPENIRDTVSSSMAESLHAYMVAPAIISRADGKPAFAVYVF